MRAMLSLVLSTIAFFVAAYYLKRWADDNDIPKGMTRNVSIAVAAIAISYVIAWVIDMVAA